MVSERRLHSGLRCSAAAMMVRAGDANDVRQSVPTTSSGSQLQVERPGNEIVRAQWLVRISGHTANAANRVGVTDIGVLNKESLDRVSCLAAAARLETPRQ
jgi:hypothetical protein